MNKFISSLLLFLFSTSVWAIPEGWYIDSIQKHPVIRNWVRLFDESAVFRKEKGDYDSVVYMGKFDKKIGENYDEIKVFSYFVKDFVPCFDESKIKYLASEHRYFMFCRTGNEENSEDYSDAYFAVYKDIEDMGLIAVIQRGTYPELARLGFDNDPAIQSKYDDTDKHQKR